MQPYMTYSETILDSGSFGGAWAIGDVNGDGYQDWFVRAAYHNSFGYFEAQIFYGGPNADLIPDALWHFRWQSDGEQFHRVGDFNGDGFDDLYKWREEGDVGFACFGSVAFDTIPDWSRTSPPEAPYQSYPEGHGDINGDGFGDIIATDFWPDAHMYVFWGSQTPDTIPQLSIPVFQYGDASAVRDLNGDQRDEVLVWRFDEVTLHLGRDSLLAEPDVGLAFPCPYPSGNTVPVGDVNGDGYNDLILFARDCFIADWDYLALYLGNYEVSPQPVWTWTNRTQPLYLVSFASAAGLGDINGDGVDDFAIGATNVDNDGTRGKVVILSGDTSYHVAADQPRPELPEGLSVAVYPNPFNVNAAIELTVPPGVKKVDLNLFNVVGQRVQAQSVDINSPRVRLTYSANDLSTGLYLLQVQAGTYCRTVKLLVLK